MVNEIIQTINGYFGEQIWQYLIIVAGFASLIAIKFYVMKTKYNVQLDQYIDPQIFIDEIKKKVKTPQQAEQILIININSKIDHQRLRNIAILVKLLNDYKYNSRNVKNIKEKLTNVPNLSKQSTKYLNYILQNTKDWE